LADCGDHPAYGLARTLAGSAAELGSYLSGDFPWSLSDRDYADLLPVLEEALDAIATGINAIHEGTHNAGETTYMHLAEATEGITGASSSLYNARDWFATAARDAEARHAVRIGRKGAEQDQAWAVPVTCSRGRG